jgi:hypothetical protein
LGTLVEHALAQPPQWPGSFVVSTQMLPHWVGDVGGQLFAHANVPLTEAQSGVLAPHTLPQAPQLEALVESTQPPSHATKPLPQPASTSSAASPGFSSPPSVPPASVSPASGTTVASLPGGRPVSIFPSAVASLEPSANSEASLPASHAEEHSPDE